jgi:hypothetical protein
MISRVISLVISQGTKALCAPACKGAHVVVGVGVGLSVGCCECGCWVWVWVWGVVGEDETSCSKEARTFFCTSIWSSAPAHAHARAHLLVGTPHVPDAYRD